MPLLKLLFTSTTLSMLLGSIAFAEYISPDNFIVDLPDYEKQTDILEYGTFKYEISWEAVQVAEAKVTINRPDANDVVKTEISVKTTKFIGLFYKLRHKTISTFVKSTYQLLEFKSDQKENSRHKLRSVKVKNGRATTEHWKSGREKNWVTFNVAATTLDPVTAFLKARTIKANLEEDYVFDILNGKHRFLITFTPKKLERISVAGEEYDSIVVTPKVKRLTDSKPEDRLREATLWISNDEKRRVLKLESEVWIGAIHAELKSFSALAPEELTETSSPPLTPDTQLPQPQVQSQIESVQ